jgi:hypothetical protein
MAEEVYIGPGEEWLVLTCHNPACQRTLLIEPVRPEMLYENGAVTIPAETLQATCPHCGLESVYSSDEIRRELYLLKEGDCRALAASVWNSGRGKPWTQVAGIHPKI